MDNSDESHAANPNGSQAQILNEISESNVEILEIPSDRLKIWGNVPLMSETSTVNESFENSEETETPEDSESGSILTMNVPNSTQAVVQKEANFMYMKYQPADASKDSEVEVGLEHLDELKLLPPGSKIQELDRGSSIPASSVYTEILDSADDLSSTEDCICIRADDSDCQMICPVKPRHSAQIILNVEEESSPQIQDRPKETPVISIYEAEVLTEIESSNSPTSMQIDDVDRQENEPMAEATKLSKVALDASKIPDIDGKISFPQHAVVERNAKAEDIVATLQETELPEVPMPASKVVLPKSVSVKPKLNFVETLKEAELSEAHMPGSKVVLPKNVPVKPKSNLLAILTQDSEIALENTAKSPLRIPDDFRNAQPEISERNKILANEIPLDKIDFDIMSIINSDMSPYHPAFRSDANPNLHPSKGSPFLSNIISNDTYFNLLNLKNAKAELNISEKVSKDFSLIKPAEVWTENQKLNTNSFQQDLVYPIDLSKSIATNEDFISKTGKYLPTQPDKSSYNKEDLTALLARNTYLHHKKPPIGIQSTKARDPKKAPDLPLAFSIVEDRVQVKTSESESSSSSPSPTSSSTATALVDSIMSNSKDKAIIPEEVKEPLPSILKKFTKQPKGMKGWKAIYQRTAAKFAPKKPIDLNLRAPDLTTLERLSQPKAKAVIKPIAQFKKPIPGSSQKANQSKNVTSVGPKLPGKEMKNASGRRESLKLDSSAVVLQKLIKPRFRELVKEEVKPLVKLSQPKPAIVEKLPANNTQTKQSKPQAQPAFSARNKTPLVQSKKKSIAVESPKKLNLDKVIPPKLPLGKNLTARNTGAQKLSTTKDAVVHKLPPNDAKDAGVHKMSAKDSVVQNLPISAAKLPPNDSVNQNFSPEKLVPHKLSSKDSLYKKLSSKDSFVQNIPPKDTIVQNVSAQEFMLQKFSSNDSLQQILPPKKHSALEILSSKGSLLQLLPPRHSRPGPGPQKLSSTDSVVQQIPTQDSVQKVSQMDSVVPNLSSKGSVVPKISTQDSVVQKVSSLGSVLPVQKLSPVIYSEEQWSTEAVIGEIVPTQNIDEVSALPEPLSVKDSQQEFLEPLASILPEIQPIKTQPLSAVVAAPTIATPISEIYLSECLTANSLNTTEYSNSTIENSELSTISEGAPPDEESSTELLTTPVDLSGDYAYYESDSDPPETPDEPATLFYEFEPILVPSALAIRMSLDSTGNLQSNTGFSDTSISLKENFPGINNSADTICSTSGTTPDESAQNANNFPIIESEGLTCAKCNARLNLGESRESEDNIQKLNIERLEEIVSDSRARIKSHKERYEAKQMELMESKRLFDSERLLITQRKNRLVDLDKIATKRISEIKKVEAEIEELRAREIKAYKSRGGISWSDGNIASGNKAEVSQAKLDFAWIEKTVNDIIAEMNQTTEENWDPEKYAQRIEDIYQKVQSPLEDSDSSENDDLQLFSGPGTTAEVILQIPEKLRRKSIKYGNSHPRDKLAEALHYR